MSSNVQIFLFGARLIARRKIYIKIVLQIIKFIIVNAPIVALILIISKRQTVKALRDWKVKCDEDKIKVLHVHILEIINPRSLI